ncbi:MAG: hypothetical protein A2Y82_04875 [Candidatus Buchananbacteria bacterium RBG_13_36_9]|uniref:Uncharacterized protein n=1 Tax=Candidatus Buchananbacteria bacterium RBG_13_36_9 TaxID=1797530 RepID=A0A1G1XQK8_9BACT|nr:MAG: hypothetical protein A2Y82_04875 [Candidatus Buchananbacteria bacterium RBG_13_36_9]
MSNNKSHIEKEPLDKLARRQVNAQLLHNFNVHTHNRKKFQNMLPEGWKIFERSVKFPIGVKESYIVNGFEYNWNWDKNKTLQEQQELIRQDLKKENFTDQEADEFIKSIKTVEWEPETLSLEESDKWLRQHPEMDDQISKIFRELNEAQKEIWRQFDRKLK